MRTRPDRREFLRSAVVAGAGCVVSFGRAPAIVRSSKARPALPCGVQSGDVTANRAVVWSRADRPSRMLVEYATTESFQNARQVVGPAALETADFTARVDLRDLSPGQRFFYRVTFQDLAENRVVSEPVTGSFRTPRATRSDVSFVWGGDVCGQGWGINPEVGGMKIYDAMRRVEPQMASRR